MKVHNCDYPNHKTARQWAKQGFLPIENAVGVELWANQFCQDSYFKPCVLSWDDARRVNGISPEMVQDAPRISEKIAEINEIMFQADTIIGYNTGFDLDFLRNNGLIFSDNVKIIDVMPVFAEIYGEYSEYSGNYKWQKLTTAANYYDYDWSSRPEEAHNSLADCYATLYVYNKINGKS